MKMGYLAAAALIGLKVVAGDAQTQSIRDIRGNVIAQVTSGELQNYRQWTSEVVEASKRNDAAQILVRKADRKLDAYQHGLLIHSYAADLGTDCPDLRNKKTDKDGCTPEGVFDIIDNLGNSYLHRSFLLSYPRMEDLVQAISDRRADPRAILNQIYTLKEKRTPAFDTPIGGPIYIDGEGGRGRDWTDGSISISNAAIDEISPLVEKGKTKVFVVRQ